jgi:hypothetical protein
MAWFESQTRSAYKPMGFPRIRALLDSYGIDDESMRLPDRVVAVIKDLKDFVRWEGLDWPELLMATNKIETDNGVVKEEFVYGAVKLFATSKEKQYGFMADNTFFHMNNGIVLGCDGGDVAVEVAKEAKPPRSGDRVVYIKAAGNKGPVATWWAYQATLEMAHRDIENRPTYRFRNKGSGAVLWEGKNISKWRLLYPLSWHASDPRWDVCFYIIEKLVGSDWVSAPDPR